MSNKKISQLPDGGTISALDLVPIVRSGVNYTVAGFGSMSLQEASNINVTGGTASGVTLTNPVIGTIKDGSSNTAFVISPSSSAVSYVTVTSAASGSHPSINATGSPTDLHLVLGAKGTGVVKLYPGSSSDSTYLYRGSGLYYAEITTGALGANRVYTLPNKSGTFAMTSDLPVYGTIYGTANEVTVVNGDLATGNPIISLPSALTFTGKTVTGGVFTYPSIAVKTTEFSIRDNSDTTKIGTFSASSIGTSTTRAYTLPNANGTLALTLDIPVAASISDQESASSSAVFVTPAVQQSHPSAAKAWVVCDDVGTITASYNITSVTDAGTGLLTVTIATDFSSANYCITATARTGSDMFITCTSQAAGSADFGCWNASGALADPVRWMITMYGDQ